MSMRNKNAKKQLKTINQFFSVSPTPNESRLTQERTSRAKDSSSEKQPSNAQNRHKEAHALLEGDTPTRILYHHLVRQDLKACSSVVNTGLQAERIAMFNRERSNDPSSSSSRPSEVDIDRENICREGNFVGDDYIEYVFTAFDACLKDQDLKETIMYATDMPAPCLVAMNGDANANVRLIQHNRCGAIILNPYTQDHYLFVTHRGKLVTAQGEDFANPFEEVPILFVADSLFDISNISKAKKLAEAAAKLVQQEKVLVAFVQPEGRQRLNNCIFYALYRAVRMYLNVSGAKLEKEMAPINGNGDGLRDAANKFWNLDDNRLELSNVIQVVSGHYGAKKDEGDDDGRSDADGSDSDSGDGSDSDSGDGDVEKKVDDSGDGSDSDSGDGDVEKKVLYKNQNYFVREGNPCLRGVGREKQRKMAKSRTEMEKWAKENCPFDVTVVAISSDKGYAAWGFTCDLCTSAYGTEEKHNATAPKFRPRDLQLGWCGRGKLGGALTVKKMTRLQAHKDSISHDAAANSASAKKNGTDAPAFQKKEFDKMMSPRRRALKKLFRIILDLVRHCRPMTDYNRERDLHARNGLTELSVTEGLLCSRDANYTSDEFVQEAVHCMAEVLRARLDKLMQQSPSIGLTNDESRGMGNHAHSLVYLRLLVKGKIEEFFAQQFVLERKPALCVKFAESVNQESLLPPNTDDIAMKGGLSTAAQLIENMQRFYPSFDLEKVDSGAVDGASSNASPRTGLCVWMNRKCSKQEMLWTHCYPHQLSLDVKWAYNSVKYMDTFQKRMVRLYIYQNKSPVRKNDFDNIQREEVGLKTVCLTKPSVERWLSNYPSVLNMRLSLRSLTIQLKKETKKMSGDKKSEHLNLIKDVCSFNFLATTHFLADLLKPVHVLHANLQNPNLVFADIKSFYLPVKAQLQRLQREINDETAPNLFQFLEELRTQQITHEEIPALVTVFDKTPEHVAGAVGDLYRAFVSNVAQKLIDELLSRLIVTFETGADLETVVSLENLLVLSRALELGKDESLHSIPGESPEEKKCFTRDLHSTAKGLKLSATMKAALSAEHSGWRDIVCSRQLLQLSRGKTPLVTSAHLLAALTDGDGNVAADVATLCPVHVKLLEILCACPMTSVGPERGFSWLKRFVTSLSNSMGSIKLDDAMMMALNGPKAETPHEEETFLEEAVIMFCDKSFNKDGKRIKRKLDSDTYNDKPNQQPKKSVAAKKEKPVSSFVNVPKSSPLPMPENAPDEDGDQDARTDTFRWIMAWKEVSRKKAEDRRLRVNELASMSRAAARERNLGDERHSVGGSGDNEEEWEALRRQSIRAMNESSAPGVVLEGLALSTGRRPVTHFTEEQLRQRSGPQLAQIMNASNSRRKRNRTAKPPKKKPVPTSNYNSGQIKELRMLSGFSFFDFRRPLIVTLRHHLSFSGPKKGRKGSTEVKKYSLLKQDKNRLHGKKVFLVEEFTEEGKTVSYDGASGIGWDVFKSPDGQEYVVFEHLVLESGLRDDHEDSATNWGVACDRLFKPQANHPGYLLYLDTQKNVSYKDLWDGSTQGKLLLLHTDSCRAAGSRQSGRRKL